MYAKDGMNRAALLGHNTRISSSLCRRRPEWDRQCTDKDRQSQTLDASVFVGIASASRIDVHICMYSML